MQKQTSHGKKRFCKNNIWILKYASFYQNQFYLYPYGTLIESSRLIGKAWKRADICAWGFKFRLNFCHKSLRALSLQTPWKPSPVLIFCVAAALWHGRYFLQFNSSLLTPYRAALIQRLHVAWVSQGFSSLKIRHRWRFYWNRAIPAVHSVSTLLYLLLLYPIHLDVCSAAIPYPFRCLFCCATLST